MLWCLQRFNGWICVFSCLLGLILWLVTTKDFIHYGKPSAFLLFRVFLFLYDFVLFLQQCYLWLALAGGLIETLSGKFQAQLSEHTFVSLSWLKLLLDALLCPSGEQYFDLIWCPNSPQCICWKKLNLVITITAVKDPDKPFVSCQLLSLIIACLQQLHIIVLRKWVWKQLTIYILIRWRFKLCHSKWIHLCRHLSIRAEDTI